MRLIDNWKLVLFKAWSLRITLVAILFSGLEVIVPLYTYDVPRGLFAVCSAIVSVVAFISRIFAQKELSGGK